MNGSSSLIFSGDKPQDEKILIRYIDEFCHTIGLPAVEVDEGAIQRAVREMYDIPWRDGITDASPFKKVSAFTTSFCLWQPIITEFPVDIYREFSKHQNAIFAFRLSVEALHRAVINCPMRGAVVLENRITVSDHYWKDLVSALGQANPVNHFPLVSLIYESLAYEANSDASYKSLFGVARPELTKP